MGQRGTCIQYIQHKKLFCFQEKVTKQTRLSKTQGRFTGPAQAMENVIHKEIKVRVGHKFLEFQKLHQGII
jgi:hypothetical protein